MPPNKPPPTFKLTRGVKKKTSFQYVIYGAVGIGKTSLACYANDPIILKADGEDGYDVLASTGQVPADLPSETIRGYYKVKEFFNDEIAKMAPGTLVIDGMGEYIDSMADEVCRVHYEGNQDKYRDWQGGPYKLRMDYVRPFLSVLKKLNGLGWNIVLIFHSKIKRFSNPTGGEYDRYIPDCDAQIWDLIHRQMDAVFFMNFLTQTAKESGVVKGVGGTTRVLYTQKTDAFEAKNRFKMSPSMILSNDPSKMWSQLQAETKKNLSDVRRETNSKPETKTKPGVTK